MDQDFHYYGTYYAARTGGLSRDDATLVAKAANFIDFFTESSYAAYWQLVSETHKSAHYNVVAKLDYPRYSFQGGLFGSGVSPEDGLWCSYHFTPGNYQDPPNTPSRETVHGQKVVSKLPAFEVRDTTGGRAILQQYSPGSVDDLKYGKLLNRPQSALSRHLILDAIKCATDEARLEAILGYAIGGQQILKRDRADTLRRFKYILLGVRAHVIADTWAHQDFLGLSNVMNTYWDVNYDPNASWFDPGKWGYGRQSVDYKVASADDWHNVVLSVTGKVSNHNFEAVPNGTSYLGHGWMGHFPDFSFVQFRYKPCWADPQTAIVRDNPREYRCAWVELVSLFSQAMGKGQLQWTAQFEQELGKAVSAINTPCALEGAGSGRKSSANAWQKIFGDLPSSLIDADQEPDPNAVLSGMLEATTRLDRYGTDTVSLDSDLYLFQIAADYHFQFVKAYLEEHNLYRFTGSWSQQTSALSPEVTSLFSGDIGDGGLALSPLYGGNGGATFLDDVTHAGPLKEIRIWSGTKVDAIQCVWKKPGGGTLTGYKHGGGGGGMTTIQLDEGESITRVDGRYADTVVQLTFTTNRGTQFGPFGSDPGSAFSIANVHARGFAGRAGVLLDKIGVISGQGELVTSPVFGGPGGGAFSDAPAPGQQISQLRIWSGTKIDAIQAVWSTPDGRSVSGQKHGGSGGGLTTFTLKDGEYITRIEGRYGVTVQQLAFTTNMGNRFGPLGTAAGQTFAIDHLRVRGFTGKAGTLLDRIGAITERD